MCPSDSTRGAQPVHAAATATAGTRGADTPTEIQSVLTSLTIQPRKRVLPIAGTVVVLVLLAGLLWDVATNERFRWGIVLEYLFHPQILAGAGLTVALTVIAMVIGVVLGVVLAVMRLSANPTFSLLARGYIWFFRGTPQLVQLIFWYNIAALYPVIALGLPFGGPSIELGSANVLITPLTAAILGLSLNEAAYMAEIIRSGIMSVDPGQRDAGHALGMTEGKLMRRVILPQAMRVVIPPTGNEVISMLKGTSLVSVLAISDLLYSAQIIYALNYQTIPLLLVACAWYLVLTSLLTAVQTRIERRYGRGFQPRPVKQKRQTASEGAAK
ncbi:MAG: amino acid ABC transporter permease [Leucobacter sp.]|nr:amino acid ABC transporter permease [Leucobacter sp.]